METVHRYWSLNPAYNPCLVSVHWAAGTREGRHRCLNPLWVFDYSVSYCGRSRVGSARAPWRERASHVGHLYPPLTPYWEEFPETAPVESAYVMFRLKHDNLWQQRLMQHAPYARIEDPLRLLEQTLHETAKATTRIPDPQAFWAAQGQLCALLSLILQAKAVGQEDWILNPESNPRRPQGLADIVKEYLQTHLAESVSLADLTDVLHISSSSLSHQYKKLSGESPMQTLLSLRVEAAKIMLLRGHKQEDIAAQCGFYDAAYFSRIFMRRTGVTPRQFVNSIPHIK
jgi:AraC-like DNA-binding protein